MPGPSDRERQKREEWLREQERKRLEERRREEERERRRNQARGVSCVEWVVVAVVLGVMATAALLLFTNADLPFIN
jgi:putative copper export protein